MTNSLFVRKAWAALEQAKVNRNNADAALEEAYTVWCEAKVMEAAAALAPSARYAALHMRRQTLTCARRLRNKS